MSLALVHSRARVGVHAPEVRVEVHLSGGLPSTQIVGLPEAAVRESRERVRAALLCAQFEFPARRITINLAPADLPKDGGRFDLPIALGILAASGQIDRQALDDYEFLGELALTGELRGIDGVLPAALAAAQAGRRLIVPLANGAEAAIAGHVQAFTARTLLEVCAALNGTQPPPAAELAIVALGARALPDMADVRGQPHARRALEIAAAGGHHLLLVGSPGCGKTLLASRLPSLLPDASEAEALETAAITSISGRGLDLARWRQRPYRAPHHTASAVALVGCELAKSVQLCKENATDNPCSTYAEAHPQRNTRSAARITTETEVPTNLVAIASDNRQAKPGRDRRLGAEAGKIATERPPGPAYRRLRRALQNQRDYEALMWRS